jgi:hypothetical protein
VVRHRLIELETAKPSIGEVQMHLFALPTLRANAKAVADDEHAQDQLRVDRRPYRVAVKRGPLCAQIAKIEHLIDGSK